MIRRSPVKKNICSPSGRSGMRGIFLLLTLFFILSITVINFHSLVVTKSVLTALLSSSQAVGDVEGTNQKLPSSPKNNVVADLCTFNPYVGSLDTSLEDVAAKSDVWLSNMAEQDAQSNRPEMKKHDHSRFFPFNEVATCTSRSCVGGPCSSDSSKIICGLDDLGKNHNNNNNNNNDGAQQKCVVYSVGGNDNWEFELDILKRTPCEVHTFDCTGPVSRFHVPDNPNLTFHHVCLGAESMPAQKKCQGTDVCGKIQTLHEIQTMLGHLRIDLLKMDIEGYEWPLFESWPELTDVEKSKEVILPMQIAVEVHYQTQMEMLWSPNQKTAHTDWKFPPDIVKLQAHLLKMGYATVVRDDNPACKHCTELTLLRYRCPKEGSYAVLASGATANIK